jgi:hypothetical protein
VKKFLMSLWLDESRFIGVCRGLVMALGQALTQDLVPTGVPGLGPKLGAILSILSVTVPAGNKTK